MTVALQADSYSIPEENALKMRGVQTDPFGEVLGGHKAIFDFAATDMPDILAVNDIIPNVILGASAAVCKGSFGAGLIAAKGLVLEDNADGGTAERVDLPADGFDFAQFGTESSFVFSTWLTPGAKDADDGAFNSVMGFAYQTSSQHQWSIAQYATGSDALNFAMRESGSASPRIQVLDLTAHANQTHLITAYVQVTASNTFTLRVYRGNTLLQTRADKNFDWVVPTVAGATPRIGTLGGHGDRFAGVVHRVQSFKVNPDFYDIDAWLASEIAQNSGRF